MMETPSRLSPEKQALLEQRLKGEPHQPVTVSGIPKRPDRGFAPLSFAQRQMWVIDQITPGNSAYSQPNGYRLRGSLDLTALEESFNEVIKRHEALRTTFAVRDGEPLQLIYPELTIKVHVIGLDHLTGEERESRLQALASEESVKSFDLSCLPLIRVTLFKLGEAEHVVIINLHHIVSDGLSIGLMLDELDTFYRAFTSGTAPQPPDLPVQYADFALWQRQTMANEAAFANQITFWRKQLGGKLPVLEMPGDLPRPPFQSFKGSNVFFNIPKALAQDLRSLGAREGCTFFMTVLAAFQVLLQRYSGSEDIIIGTPVSARTPREVEPLIGMFINMAALRCDLSGNPDFIELLRRSRDTTLNAFSNSDLPFDAMVNHLKFERDPSRNPVFQVLLQVLSTTAPRIGDLEISSFHFDLKFAHFDLSLHLYEDAGGYTGRFEYCSELFEAQTIRRLCGHFRTLLEAIARDPNQSISMLPLLTEAERRQLLVDWNETKTEYPENALVHQLFEAQAKRTPDAVAVVFEDQGLTYAELNRRANRLAHHLRELGVTRDQVVGLRIDRGVEMVIGLLGVLKAGGAYLPLDPAYPRDRVAFILEDLRVAVVVTQKSLAIDLEGIAVTHVLLDEPLPGAETDPAPVVTADDLAYVIYTSGSTGKPKGVAVEHRQIANYVRGIVQRMEFRSGENFATVSTIAADLGNTVVFPSLCYGGCLHVISGDRASDPAAFAEYCERHRIDCLKIVPSHLAALLSGPYAQKVMPRQRLILGGESSRCDWISSLQKLSPECVIFNHYGPTEATVGVLTYRIGEQLPFTCSGTLPLGRPIANSQMYILDQLMQPVPIGVAGELYIGGDGVARGYLNRPEITSERFLPNPFSDEPGARLYRTGDQVRYLVDGNIEFLGRVDHQVKVRGYRVELGEIEAVLAEHPEVRQAVVHLWMKVDDVRIVACCVPAKAGVLAPISLRKHMRARLPEYMIPQYFLPMEEIPLTPNGKVDRRRLPTPVVAESGIGQYEAPADPIEAVIAEIWTKLIDPTRPIGRNDRFFEMGGHSLLGLQALGQMEQKFGVRLDFRVFFQESLADIATRCRSARTGGGEGGKARPVSLLAENELKIA